MIPRDAPNGLVLNGPIIVKRKKMNKAGNVNRLSLAEEQSIYRILDASANRCREGLRVIEEFVRFHQEDEQNVRNIKEIRHLFSQICLQLDLEQAMQARDTPGDVGTKITLPTEMSRQSLQELVRANCSRVGEALRTLEEYSKLIAVEAPALIEKIRYQFYSVEKQLLQNNSRRARLENSVIYFLISAESCRGEGTDEENFETVAKQAIAAGVDLIQLREKKLSDRELLKRARLLREWTLGTNTLFVVNDRPDLALLCDADGVHVGQEELPVKEVRKIVGQTMLIGVSTHNLSQARDAVADGADYLGVGPVFLSQTKQFGQLAGLELVKQVAAEIRMPWFSIGGINCTNISDVVSAGSGRIAVSQALCETGNTSKTVKILKKSLKGAGTFPEMNSSK